MRKRVGLAVLAVVTAVPAAVRGPDYVLDDWFLLANARFDGWSHALPRDLFLARPGSGVVFAAVFGLLGRHPMAPLVVQVALVATAAFLLHALLRRFVSDGLAAAAAALWLVVPNHGSLLHWASATPLTVALILLLAGLVLVDDGRLVPAGLLLAAAVLTYEATAPAAVAGLAAIPLLGGRAWRRPLLIGGAFVLPAGLWIFAFFPSVKRGLDQRADLMLLVPAHVGWGVFPDGPLATIGGALACVGVVLVAMDAVRRRSPLSTEAAMVFAGVAVIILGTLPFVAYFYAPLGAGDRVNVVAGVGTALLWSGLGASMARRVPLKAFAVVASAVVVGMAVVAWQSSTAWADAADDAARILDRLPTDVARGDVVIVARPRVRRNVAAFADHSNIAGAVQLEAGTRDVDARLRPGR